MNEGALISYGRAAPFGQLQAPCTTGTQLPRHQLKAAKNASQAANARRNPADTAKATAKPSLIINKCLHRDQPRLSRGF